MTNAAIRITAAIAVLASGAWAQSPPAQTAIAVGGKNLSVKYSAPSVRGRKIFGPGGLLSNDPTYPAWRAGANSATLFHTDADLDIGGLAVPKGNYSIYVWVENPEAWQLIVNRQTGQWGLSYEAKQDLGRVKMTMSKPPKLIETFKITLSAAGGNTAKLQLEWENHIASVPITVK